MKECDICGGTTNRLHEINGNRSYRISNETLNVCSYCLYSNVDIFCSDFDDPVRNIKTDIKKHINLVINLLENKILERIEGKIK